MPNYDETWVTLPSCDGPCPMLRSLRNDQWGWRCAKCGAYKRDVIPPKPEAPGTIEYVKNYGCVVIVVAFFALLAWVAYLVFQFPPAQ